MAPTTPPNPESGVDFHQIAQVLAPFAAVLAAVGAAFTIKSTILKRLAKIRDVTAGGAKLGTGFNWIYGYPQIVNLVVAFLVVLGGAAFAAYIWLGQAGILASNQIVDPAWALAVFVGLFVAISLDLLSWCLWLMAILFLRLARMFSLLRSPDPLAVVNAGSFLGWDDQLQVVAIRAEPLEPLAAEAMELAISGKALDRAADPNTPVDQRANLALVGCCIEHCFTVSKLPKPSWNDFYAALDEANIADAFAAPQTIQGWRTEASYFARIKAALDPALSKRGQATLPDLSNLHFENALRALVSGLKQARGDAQRLAGDDRFPSLERVRKWCMKRPEILGQAGMPAQFVKLAHRWGAWRHADLFWFVFPKSDNLAAFLLNRGALVTTPDVKELDFSRKYLGRMLGEVELAIADRAVDWIGKNPAAPTSQKLNEMVKDAPSQLRWRIADVIDTALWSLARKSESKGGTWSAAGGKVVRK